MFLLSHISRILPIGAILFSLSMTAQAEDLDFAMGKALFDRPWAAAPASTQAADGLGPLFNARACVSCHKGGGRGDIQTPDNDDGYIGSLGYVIRVGDENGKPDPVYGSQIQGQALPGIAREARVSFIKNHFHLDDWQYGEPAEKTRFSARLSQPLHGLGLLEQVPDQYLESLADPDDLDGDGISGRINRLPDGRIGRFAWKAAAPDLYVQAANAFSNDLGLSTSLHRAPAGDCTASQQACQNAPHGNSPQFDNLEISDTMLQLVATYLRGLPPPKAHDDDKGLALFVDTGCGSCHQPSLPLPKGRKLHAFTDLLLHDMGDGLADGIKEGDASPREWRTQPLWGTKTALAKGQRFLHDGRASTLDEAIRWHGGEAAAARQNYLALTPQIRQRLLDYIGNL